MWKTDIFQSEAYEPANFRKKSDLWDQEEASRRIRVPRRSETRKELYIINSMRKTL
jgi:hypothetical protein